MKEFRALLKEKIKESGKNISTISRESGVERTSLHKALSGERMLPYHAVKKLCTYFNLTPHEEEIFCEYYNIQVQGIEKFESRKIITHILNELANLPFNVEKTKKIGRSAGLPEEMDYTGISTGSYAVRNMICNIVLQELREENPKLYIFLPPQDEFLMYYLYNIFNEYQTDMEVWHIIPYFVNNDIQKNSGLEAFERILPIILTAREKYHSYYFYCKIEDIAIPFPNYIITRRGILHISSDLMAAYYDVQTDVVNYYRTFFNQAIQKSTSLLVVQQNILSILQTYSETIADNSYYTFMPQPCMARFYTDELIEQKVRQGLPGREMIVRQSQLKFAEISKVTGDYFTFFTEKGVRQFIQTGVISDIPTQMIEPLSVEERCQLIKQLKDGIENDVITGRFVITEKLMLPQYLSFSVTAKKQIEIFTLPQNEQQESFYNIHVDEPILGEMFLDFVQYLPKSDLVFSKEETVKKLGALLEAVL